MEILGLNGIFHWYAYWETFDKSSGSLFEESKWSLTTAKRDASSEKVWDWEEIR